MPTYEYACDACGFEFEREQRITEDPIRECPKCHKNDARRMISGSNFMLKGGGWYADLYSSTSKKSDGGEKASGSSPKSDAPKSDAPKESAKPEKKKSEAKSAAVD